jgi:carboxymethylenebutenolidase
MGDLQPGTPVAVGYEALPASGAGPGVLVLHAWWGLNGVVRTICDRLAEAGFVAVAPDLWGGTVATTIEEAESLLEQRDGAAMEQATTDALTYLRAHPAVRGAKLGAIGFSMGAAWAIALSGEHPDLRAVALFYGCGETDYTAAGAAYLGHFAESDPYESEEYLQQMEAAMRAAGREVEIHRYAGVGHWFFEEDRPDAYNPAAASLAWERTLPFLRERLA